jgi:exodeoxyribonuclease V alpha subunit
MADDDSWSVVSLALRPSGREITAVGSLAGAQVGESLRLTGRWTVHPKYGERFQVLSFSTMKPATVEGIERYLGSGLVKGIGKELAARLVRRFGLETLDVIDGHPGRLREVEGIGPQRARQIVEAWQAGRDIRDLMVFLQSYGVTPGLAAKIHKRYGTEARKLIEQNPYRLAEEITGVGFLTADRIALKLDGSPESPHRLEAGAVFTLKEKGEEGHTLVGLEELAEECGRLLGLESGKCLQAIDRMSERGEVVLEESEGVRLAGLPALVGAEAGSAELLAGLVSFPFRPASLDIEREILGFEEANGIHLSENQKNAVRHACTDKVFVVTGGPGTGKTTMLKGILAALTRAGRTILLCAPTGRAAKRIEEATGREARTIHRLLEYSPQKGGFARNRSNQLSCDVLIADEASMIDIGLFHQLLQALPTHCQLILVGDKDQLPSVGPGNVLRDLIRSAVVPVVHLTEVFRQAERSSIVLNAHKINAGELPSLKQEELSDFFFIERSEPEEIIETLHELIRRRIPNRFGLDPMQDIQVLTPMQRGTLGAVALNRDIQGILNPDSPALWAGATAFRLGDRVMQLHNDYERGVYNGDIGRIDSVDESRQSVSVLFDGRPVSYDREDLDGISLAYACTVHKAQGSEFPAVIVLLHTQHYVLLARNLLYTAVTRGRRLTVIVGSRKALAIAVKSSQARTRTTGLTMKLKKAMEARRPA